MALHLRRLRGRLLRRRALRWALAGLLVLYSGAAVALPGQPGAPEVIPLRVRFIPAPGGYFAGQPAWLPGSDRVVVTFLPQGGESIADIWLDTVDLATGLVRRLPVAEDPTCRARMTGFPSTLPDGRVAYIRECGANTDGTGRDPAKATQVMVYDPATGISTPLLPYYVSLRAGFVSFAPDMRVGIYDDGNGLYERLHWLYPSHEAVIDLPLARVGTPAWSPDGRKIAVIAAPQPGVFPGYPGVERLDVPATLFLLSPATLRLRPLVAGLVIEGGLAWSPDGRWLVGDLNFGGRGSGLWLVDPATGRYFRVAVSRPSTAPTWLPDGRTVVATVGASGDDDVAHLGPSGLDVITLPNLQPFTNRDPT